MQLSNFIDVFLALHVSGTYAHHQEHYMLSCSIWFSAPSFWMGGGLESCCVGRATRWLFFTRLYREGGSTKNKKLMSVCQPSRDVIKSFQW